MNIKVNKTNQVAMNRSNPCNPCKRFTFGAYGLLPKDCWTLIGNRCNITTKLKIAYMCTALKQHYFRQYVKLEKWHNRLDPTKETLYTINELLYFAAKGGHRDLVDFFISKGAYDWNWGLKGAAQCTDSTVRRDLVDYFISKGADNWDQGLWGAAKGGHRDLVDFFILKGADNWDWGLQGAASCKANATVYRDLVNFFISKGANNWDTAIRHAAKSGHRDLIDLFISKGADDWSGALDGAARGNHRDLVDFFIEKVDDSSNMGLNGAVTGNHRDLVDFFILKYNESGIVIYWNNAIEIAEIYGHYDLADYLFKTKMRKCESAEAQ